MSKILEVDLGGGHVLRAQPKPVYKQRGKDMVKSHDVVGFAVGPADGVGIECDADAAMVLLAMLPLVKGKRPPPMNE
jgi:hypothetical protein